MPTVEEILKASGLDEAAIKALDAKVLSGFTTVLTAAQTAEQKAAAEKVEAERVARAQQEMYDTQIAPGLDNWANEKAQKEAELAFYKAQAESAKAGGFLPHDAPGYTPPPDPNAASRGTDGRFVPGANPVPGSPKFMTQEDAYGALAKITYIQNEHFRLFGTPPPDDLDTLAKEAAAQHMDIKPYASQKYKFEDERKRKAEAAQKAHDDDLIKKTEQRKDQEWAEKVGSNPMVRTPESSQFSTISKAVAAGQRKDPLMMTEAERSAYTRQEIGKEIATNESERVH